MTSAPPRMRPAAAQRLAGYLIDRACQRLPGDARGERQAEWAAELPAILHDPDVRPAFLRRARVLSFALGISLTTRRLRRARIRASRPGASAAAPGSPGHAPLRRVLRGVVIEAGVVGLFVGLTAAFRLRGFWPLVPVVLAGGAAFVVFCLADLARARDVRYLPKWGWAVACLVQVPFGGIMYLSAGRVRSGDS